MRDAIRRDAVVRIQLPRRFTPPLLEKEGSFLDSPPARGGEERSEGWWEPRSTVSRFIASRFTASRCIVSRLWIFLAIAAPSHAQEYPTKPIRLIVPFAPGGPTDIMSRAISERIPARLGQPLIVDNRAGAGGSIGSEIAAHSAPDGYTMLLGHIGTHAINVSLYARTGYDPVKDFAPITMIATLPLGLWVNASVPANSVKELVALAKAKPAQLNFGSAGSGGPTHMAGEMLKAMAHIDIVHVPYKGNAASLTDLVAGRVQIMFSNLLTAGPHARAGKLRGLAITSAKRSPQAPDMPTVAESGVAGYDLTPWYGLLFPAGTPRAIVTQLNREIGAILTAPEMADRFRSQGIDLVTSTPEAFGALIKSEIPKWRKVVKDSGATAG
jgi:tripartite-type tricarboxylate transporter receptor subunit TctC